MSPLHLLGEYESLMQKHQEQFAPALTQLQELVDQMVHQLRQQERPLVEAQVQQLAQLQAQLATDARCLLNSVELQTFIAQLQAMPATSRWNYTEPMSEVDVNPANWQLTQMDLPLAIRDYETTVDHEAYNDERTYSAYGYRVTIIVGQQRQQIEVLTKSIYSPVDHGFYSLREQLYYFFEDEVEKLLAEQNITLAQDLLAQEISCLFGCAVGLLLLAPQTVQFNYSSTEADSSTLLEGNP